MTFPLSRHFRLRNVDSHKSHQRRGTCEEPVFGVKGTSPLNHLLSLPVHVPYDVMHLVYLGMAKRLLQIVVDKRLVDLKTLSKYIDGIKVPHSFRRRPKNLIEELSLWKSQEHKIFLLYFAPLCFSLQFLSSSRTDDVTQIALLYLCLSSSIYVLTAEYVDTETLESVSEILYFFQTLLKTSFGPGVCTGTLHSLIHLPRQVENFGGLSATSAMCFENVNRFLKRSVSGKKRQGLQIAERFLCMKQTCQDSGQTKEKLATKSTSAQNLLLSQLSLSSGDVTFFDKVCSNVVLHSYDFGKNLRSASYFAFVKDKSVFVKIKCIFKTGEAIKCFCRTYTTSCCWHDMFTNVPPFLKRHLLRACRHFNLRKGDMEVFDAKRLTNYAIVHKISSSAYYAVRILSDHDHE